jgi:uncharacterized protein (UPF0276 family)
MIVTPYSSLFKSERDRNDIIEQSDAVEIRRRGQAESIKLPKLPKLYHCELSLVNKWNEKEKEDIKKILTQTKFELVSFHLISRYSRNILIDGIFHGLGRPYREHELLFNANENISFLRSELDGKIPILIENNNYLGTDAYDIVTDNHFIKKVVEEFSLFFLWDIAHSFITSINKKVDLEEQLITLPLNKCLQVHLSRYEKANGFAIDAHESLRDDDWVFFSNMVNSLPLLQYITIEYYKSKEKLINQLKKLRHTLSEVNFAKK